MNKDENKPGLYLGNALPAGFCDGCMRRMAAGADYQAVRLPDGAVLVNAYCEHREAGATMLLRKGRPLRWNLTMPIDVVEWRQLLELRAHAISGAAKARDLAIVAQPAAAGTAPADAQKEWVN